MASIGRTISEVKRLLAVGGIGLFAAAGLAACGGDEDAGDGGSDESTSASAVEEETAAEEAASYGDGTSPDAPLEPGASVEVGDWSVSLGEVVFDATDQILESEAMNEAPEAGNQYAMIELSTTYNGDGSSDPFMDLAWGLWDGGEKLEDAPIVLAPNDLVDVGEVAAGETASGNVVIEVPEGDYAHASVVISELMGETEFYLAVG